MKWFFTLILALVTSPASAADAPLVDTDTSPHAVVQPVGLGEVKWTEGFWADRFATCTQSSIPSMWRLMESGEYKPFLEHFLIAAGRSEGDHHGAKWNDGDFYKWIEAATAAFAQTGDKQLEAGIERSIEAIGAAQRDDGYLHTPILIRQRNGDAAAEPFGDRLAFEVYNMGHLITAACVHYRVTGRTNFLEIAERAADFLAEAFRHPTPEQARHAICPSHYMGIVELYRATGKPEYLALAEHFLAMRNLVLGGGDDNQDRIPFLQQRTAAGHAVRANYLYAGAADLFAETGNEALLISLNSIWRDVVQKKMYLTGGCGALYDGASPDGSADQAHITRVHQAYGRDYQLPNVTAHNETCANVGNVLWNWRMFTISGEAQFLDVLEQALYNSVLSGVSLSGDEYFYVNPLRVVDPMPVELRFPRTRQKFFSSFCCPPNVVRTIAEVNAYTYSKSDDTLWVNLYGGSRLETELGGKPLVVVQKTRYPWDGHVELKLDTCPNDDEFSIKLRIPGWTSEAKIAVNGAAVDVAVEPGSFATLTRRWQAGDSVVLDLPLVPQLFEANPLVEEATRQVAVKCGPVVYCLESADLPPGVRVGDVLLPLDADLLIEYQPEKLGGVNVISADAVAVESPAWGSKLYRPAQPQRERKFTAEFIPYYAWANRGPSEMTVFVSVD